MPKDVNSSFDKAAGLIGDRWMLSILRQFLLRSSLSFTELLAAIRGIATNILADRLRTLRSEGILSATAGRSDARRLLYSFTPKGSNLEPVLEAIDQWGKKYHRHDPQKKK